MPRNEVRHPSDPVGEQWDFEYKGETSKRLPRPVALMAQIWEQRRGMAEKCWRTSSAHKQARGSWMSPCLSGQSQ